MINASMAKHAMAAPIEPPATKAERSEGKNDIFPINHPVKAANPARSAKREKRDILHDSFRYSPVNLPLSLKDRVRLTTLMPSTNMGMIVFRARSAHAAVSMGTVAQEYARVAVAQRKTMPKKRISFGRRSATSVVRQG
jgi:hypothetical protein